MPPVRAQSIIMEQIGLYYIHNTCVASQWNIIEVFPSIASNLWSFNLRTYVMKLGQ